MLNFLGGLFSEKCRIDDEKRIRDAYWEEYVSPHSFITRKGAKTDKCPCCGSREFRQHAGRSVCAYCRSER